LIPIAKNKILLRLENLADLFDFPGHELKDTAVTFDLQTLANGLYQQVNGASAKLS
jgi:hypothetical protein